MSKSVSLIRLSTWVKYRIMSFRLASYYPYLHLMSLRDFNELLLFHKERQNVFKSPSGKYSKSLVRQSWSKFDVFTLERWCPYTLDLKIVEKKDGLDQEIRISQLVKSRWNIFQMYTRQSYILFLRYHRLRYKNQV